MRARHSLKMYNGLVERCFMSCVDTFRRKTLEKNEEVVRVLHSMLLLRMSAVSGRRLLRHKCGPRGSRPASTESSTPDSTLIVWPATQCVTKCCEKFLKHSARVSLRFAELNQGQEQPKS